MTAEEERQVVNMIASQALDHMIDQAVILQQAKRGDEGPEGRGDLQRVRGQGLARGRVAAPAPQDHLGQRVRAEAEARRAGQVVRGHEGGVPQEDARPRLPRAPRSTTRSRATSPSRGPTTTSTSRTTSSPPASPGGRSRSASPSTPTAPRPARRPTPSWPACSATRTSARSPAASDGPTASKGGLYPDMTPGSYGIPVVNDELNRLPIGQVSTILEAPAGFHIVRVESRREAGPSGSTRSRTRSGPRSWSGTTRRPSRTT